MFRNIQCLWRYLSLSKVIKFIIIVIAFYRKAVHKWLLLNTVKGKRIQIRMGKKKGGCCSSWRITSPAIREFLAECFGNKY